MGTKYTSSRDAIHNSKVIDSDLSLSLPLSVSLLFTKTKFMEVNNMKGVK